MKVRYLKSASVAVETKGVKILTDPWLTDGEYYGSWYHYPTFKFDEEYFSDVDFIYVSHIHPDHFSKPTFRLLNRNIPVLIHQYESKFLKQNIERLGFSVIEIPHNQRTHLKNGVCINILAADNCNPELCAKFFGCGLVEAKFGSTQIDTLSVIDDGVFSLLNINDCPFDLAKNTLPLLKNNYPKIDIMLVGYGGAGPYPQCFDMPIEEKMEAAEKKKMQFLTQGLDFINEVKPDYIIPFAGTYVLGGRLSRLQNLRGVPEVEDAAEYFTSKISPNQKIILVNSYEYFDLESKSLSNPYMPIDKQKKQAYIDEVLSEKQFDFEQDEMPANEEIVSLMEMAYIRFENKRKEINFNSKTNVLIKIEDDCWGWVSVNGDGFKIISGEAKREIKNYVSYTVDKRLLHNILKGPRFAHWNNAEIGSHVNFERNPAIFERGLYYCMCFFHS